MAQFLRQSTASQEIQLGPFVDDTDGKTAETALTISNTDIKLFKHGGTSQTDKNSGGATHMANGYYSAVLDATDTNTVGNLEITVNESGALPVRREYVVLEPVVYDALFADGAAFAELADAILNRSVSTIEATMPQHSLGGIILAMLENSISGTTLLIKGTDGTTTRFTKTVTTDAAAEPITGVN
jgi:hypothetical protein